MKSKEKSDKQLNASETLTLISKLYANVNDIQLLAHCGRDKAKKIKSVIEKELEGHLLPKGEIPMSKLVEYLKIDIRYLKKVSEFSKEEKEI